VIALGMMSGTSLDGIDAALVRIVPRQQSYTVGLLRLQSRPYDGVLREELAANLPPHSGSVAAVARLHRALGDAYARAASETIGADRVDFVASHGQTLWHDGGRHVTLQLGDAFAIREATGVSVCYDFRSADCAAGGQGAPLVAYVDALLLGDASEDRAALNLGGIANVTLLSRGAPPSDATAFDTGPGNMLLDAFVAARTHGAAGCDEGGRLALAGRVDERALRAMLADEYFSLPPPKSTGRERFGAQFLATHDDALRPLRLEDGAATLAELTAASVAQAFTRSAFAPARVIVSGGGARNAALLERLAAHLRPAIVESSDARGLPAQAKEAMAFAVLGYETLRGRASGVPRATGAARAAMLGAIAPANLPALLQKLRLEVDAKDEGADDWHA
jgi:anhydro-N-acetylmuramic acid kinase